MRHLIAIALLIIAGWFFGFDRLFEVIVGEDHGIPSCQNKHVVDILRETFILQALHDSPFITASTETTLRQGTRIQLSKIEKVKDMKEEDRIYCKANFKVKNDSTSLYFEGEGIVDYEIALASKQEIASIPRKYIQGGKKLDYESAPTTLLIKNVYAKWNMQKFEAE